MIKKNVFGNVDEEKESDPFNYPRGIMEQKKRKELTMEIYELIRSSFVTDFRKNINYIFLAGSKRIKVLLLISVVFMFLGILALITNKSLVGSEFYNTRLIIRLVGNYLLFTGVTTFVLVYLYASATKNIEYNKQINDLIRKADKEPKAAWDIARMKLEGYLSRNLSHVKYIFLIVLLIMTFGFVIIGYGIYKVYDDPNNFKPSIVAACSGIIVEFIAATFLVLHHSISAQASKYIEVIERINAVGMSLQILDNIDDAESQLANNTKAELARQLIEMYKTK